MKADFTTPPCCDKQSIATMDYQWPIFGEPKETKVNRVCLNCYTHWAGSVGYTHWAGSVGSVVQYTRKEWDALVSDTFSAARI